MLTTIAPMNPIGRRIEQRLSERGMTKAEFARRIGTSRQNVDNILNQESLHTDMLLRICQTLDYNFFAEFIPQPTEQPKPVQQRPKMILTVALPDDEEDTARIIKTVYDTFL